MGWTCLLVSQHPARWTQNRLVQYCTDSRTKRFLSDSPEASLDGSGASYVAWGAIAGRLIETKDTPILANLLPLQTAGMVGVMMGPDIPPAVALR